MPAPSAPAGPPVFTAGAAFVCHGLRLDFVCVLYSILYRGNSQFSGTQQHRWRCYPPCLPSGEGCAVCLASDTSARLKTPQAQPGQKPKLPPAWAPGGRPLLSTVNTYTTPPISPFFFSQHPVTPQRPALHLSGWFRPPRPLKKEGPRIIPRQSRGFSYAGIALEY